MVTLDGESLVFSFPEVHSDATLRVSFQRTLRIPDDNRAYPLPPGLGRFPLLHVDDYAEKLPASWSKRGGVFLPMYQAEALWIHFRPTRYPFAIKVAAGKINAVAGGNWQDELSRRPQDYIVAPGQPWLDGFNVGPSQIRQFVAMPLGAGYTAEEQLTGEAQFGGLQLLAVPMKPERYEKLPRRLERDPFPAFPTLLCLNDAMGLAPGGLMRQEIYQDSHGVDAWEESHRSRCYVNLLNSVAYAGVTGLRPPTMPPTAADYSAAGLPWFDYYDADRKALEADPALAGLDSVAASAIKRGEKPFPENGPIEPPRVIVLAPTECRTRRDGAR